MFVFPKPNNSKAAELDITSEEPRLDTFWICTAGNVCFQVKLHFRSCKGNDKRRKTQPIYISN